MESRKVEKCVHPIHLLTGSLFFGTARSVSSTYLDTPKINTILKNQKAKYFSMHAPGISEIPRARVSSGSPLNRTRCHCLVFIINQKNTPLVQIEKFPSKSILWNWSSDGWKTALYQGQKVKFYSISCMNVRNNWELKWRVFSKVNQPHTVVEQTPAEVTIDKAPHHPSYSDSPFMFEEKNFHLFPQGPYFVMWGVFDLGTDGTTSCFISTGE